jgi:hypothetical protein
MGRRDHEVTEMIVNAGSARIGRAGPQGQEWTR